MTATAQTTPTATAAYAPYSAPLPSELEANRRGRGNHGPREDGDRARRRLERTDARRRRRSKASTSGENHGGEERRDRVPTGDPDQRRGRAREGTVGDSLEPGEVVAGECVCRSDRAHDAIETAANPVVVVGHAETREQPDRDKGRIGIA